MNDNEKIELMLDIQDKLMYNSKDLDIRISTMLDTDLFDLLGNEDEDE